MDLAPQTKLSAAYFSPYLIDFLLGPDVCPLVLHLSLHKQNSLVVIFLVTKKLGCAFDCEPGANTEKDMLHSDCKPGC